MERNASRERRDSVLISIIVAAAWNVSASSARDDAVVISRNQVELVGELPRARQPSHAGAQLRIRHTDQLRRDKRALRELVRRSVVMKVRFAERSEEDPRVKF